MRWSCSRIDVTFRLASLEMGCFNVLWKPLLLRDPPMTLPHSVLPLVRFLLLPTVLMTPTAALAETIPSAPNPTRMDLLLTNQDDAYASLRALLNAQNWQAADQETRRLLEQWVHPNQDIFGTPLASNIPADVLQTLDQLWLEASKGRFGFSVQQRIWQEVTAQYPNSTSAAVQAFGRRVGWLRPVRDNNNFVSPDWFIEPELAGSLDAPMGQFPWVGISWERIQNSLNQQSCGSCMVDSIYLQGERFNRYIPVLYERVRKVTSSTPPNCD